MEISFVKVVPEKPHRPLEKVGMRLWIEILDANSIDDVASREVLLLICEALDRAEDCRKQIAKELKELSHRVGNTLAVIQSMFRRSVQHATAMPDLETVFV